MSEILVNPDEFSKLSAYRSLIYTFFSTVFAKKVERKFLESLISHEVVSAISSVCEDTEAANKLKKRVRSMLMHGDELSEVNEKFDELFVIPVEDKFIPPYIGRYLNSEYKKISIECGNGGSCSSESGESEVSLNLIDRLTYVYKSLDFLPKDSDMILLKRPDHISCILGFMAVLINLEERYYKGQVETPLPFNEVINNEFLFFNEFVVSWVILFAGEIIERAVLPFYVETAKLMQSFIVAEQRDFKSVLLQN